MKTSGQLKRKTSMTLSREALRLLALLAQRSGISKSSTLEMIIREKARAEGVE